MRLETELSLDPFFEFNADAADVQVSAYAGSPGTKGFLDRDAVLDLIAVRGTWAWPDARVKLVASIERFVHKTARRFARTSTVCREDLAQAGLVGVLNATECFDPEQGFQFNTYAGTAARNEMLKLVKSKGPQFISLDANPEYALDPESEGPSVLEEVQTRHDVKKVHEVLSRMTPKNRLALVRRFGIGSNVEQGLPGIAKEMGWASANSARFLVDKAMKEFRQLLASPRAA